MFSQPKDWASYKYPQHGLLQAHGIVKNKEMRSPQHLDISSHKCLHVMKNGLAMSTTMGCVNGLDSFACVYTKHGVEQTLVKVAILLYDRKRGAFSVSGDSGAIVLERGGSMLTGGGSDTTEDTDISYLTPYWWLEEQIKKVFPSSYLYDIVQ